MAFGEAPSTVILKLSAGKTARSTHGLGSGQCHVPSAPEAGGSGSREGWGPPGLCDEAPLPLVLPDIFHPHDLP